MFAFLLNLLPLIELDNYSPLTSLTISIIVSVCGFFFTLRLLSNELLMENFKQKGLYGRDLHRKDRPEVPEAMGVVSGLVYLICVFIYIPVPFLPWMFHASNFPYDRLAIYLSALLSLTCMLFLGFSDDVLDLKWRYKLIIPTIASIPLLLVYSTTYGVTTIAIPKPLTFIFGSVIDIGVLYYVYMSMLSVFCTNSINILAGINGIEVGQSLIIALSLIFNDSLYILSNPIGPLIAEAKSLTKQSQEVHLFSLYLLIPFAFVSLALFLKNKYPANVFVGDTFCYFAGMTFACVGILGRYSKTLLLFFIPQIFNFAYGLPQLSRIIGCPRHRMPGFDEETGKLTVSYVKVNMKSGNKLGLFCLRVYELLGLVRIKRDSDPEKEFVEVNNLTLLNLILVWFGEMEEWKLTYLLMVVQFVFGTLLTFIIRYGLVYFAYY